MSEADVHVAAPKVLLHDHLDGGLRPQTIIDLAAERGHDLPTDDAGRLAAWFVESASSGSLERYLETFRHTVGVMQTAPAITRVARECVEDLAADGVVYAELRYAPEQHLADERPVQGYDDVPDDQRHRETGQHQRPELARCQTLRGPSHRPSMIVGTLPSVIP